MPRYRPPRKRGSAYITAQGERDLRAELHQLWKVERPQITAAVHEAAKNGDRSENGDYIYGKKRLRQIDSRRRFLIKRLEIARIADPADISAPEVRFGATVLIEDEDGNEKRWRLYGEDEVDVERGIISWRSPIGRAMMGKEEGDDFTFQAPGGKRTYELVEVSYEPCAPLSDEELDFSR